MRANKRKILLDLNQLLKLKFSDNLKDVVLFGSRAFGGSKKDSDYDILIVLKQKVDWEKEREISDLCYDIEFKYNVVLDTHILGEEEFSTLRGKQPIFVNALEKGYRA